MFRMNDYIMYGLTGVCKVIGIEEEKFLDYPQQSFYVLEPVFSPQMTIKIPVLNTIKNIRPIHSTDEVKELIQKIPDLGLLWIFDERERNNLFRQMLRNANCDEWIIVIKTIYSYKYLDNYKGKRLNKNDDEIFKIAEKLLNEEFGFVLNINPDDVPTYIGECII
ncbi:CarD family transcriptional regulator [Turicibacter sanguinis]|uniref:CarD family transcriptional regulator n=1 Tax=Turicibacter sanguinis TaxID=154288 RepID=UPI0012BD05B9|nr:CarD family transcriptional regulator [Turicibacter sanguinis]MDB8566744.1 CarD family transcriptional regulator [Turicibacter sanguinis]MDB8569495.1 CarD family transcriptional regulator [Turicibacter sanguinis]MDB8572245.1 CarD family transcriptional regulator [Turicibacter sanguinis]MDB8580887.1 CarD family transcriptional regulator [Turicibacter sanguinis]MTO09507.1 CarD family transcriptional regulator [Turicibacter sanguinis]